MLFLLWSQSAVEWIFKNHEPKVLLFYAADVRFCPSIEKVTKKDLDIREGDIAVIIPDHEA